MRKHLNNHSQSTIRAVPSQNGYNNFMDKSSETSELDLESIEEKEIRKIESASKRIQEIKARKAELIANKEAEDRIRKQEHLDNHKHYLSEAQKATTIEDEKKLRGWAEDELRQANEILVDGFVINVEKPKVSFKENALKWLFTHFGSWIIIVGILLVGATFCYNHVIEQKELIMKINSIYASSGQTSMMIAPPLDERNIQQIWFDKFQLIVDMGFALFMLLVLSPHNLLSLLPFTKLPKNLWLSYQSIPETQKQWLSFAWCSLVLLVLALSHLGK
jgi:hypothetical protein